MNILLLFYAIASTLFQEASGVQIYKFYIEKFKEDQIEIEYQAYRQIESLPSNSLPNLNYVAIPWAVLINMEKKGLTTVKQALSNIKIKNGWTVCQHDYLTEYLPIMKKIGIKVVFSPNAELPLEFYDVKIIPFPGISVNSSSPAKQKDIVCSFVGSEWTHSCRTVMFKLFENLPEFTLIKRTGTWHFFNKDRQQVEQNKREYIDILSRSRFSLCPRGIGANSFRFWESLEAGAIPILISDQLVLPYHIDWEKTIIRIKESEINNIPDVINSISIEQEQIMRKNCLNAFKKLSGDYYIKPIIDSYENLSQDKSK